MDHVVYDGELKHYGVKGMKWGVRKYRNYDGSYTKKGLARYDKAESRYDEAKSNAARVKSAYKSGAATKSQYKSAKSEVKSAKREMSDSYKRLKTDKQADEGKKLYRQGKTITDNNQRNMLTQVAIVVGSRVASNVVLNTIGDQKVANLSAAAIGIGGTAVNAILAGKTMSDNKKLRAYYAHG